MNDHIENLGLNDDVAVGGRKFHVQTSVSPSENMIVSQVFHDGVVLDSRKVSPPPEMENTAVEARVKEIHQELITEMEVLYYINEKVKTVQHAPSANKLGMVFLQKSLYDEAVEQFRLALKLDPSFSEVYANLGKTYLVADSYDAALEILQQGVEQAPAFADIQNYLGIALLYKKDYDTATRHLQEALSLNPNYIGAHYHLGIALLAKSLAEQDAETASEARSEAVQHLKQASDSMVNRSLASLETVLQKVDSEDYEAAVEEFYSTTPRASLMHFLNIENEFYLKFMYGGKGKDDSFISDYVVRLRELIDKHPDYADVRNNLGVANLIQCRNLFLKALEEFRTALKLNPNYKKAEKNLKLAENDGKGFLILLRAILK